MRRALDYGNGVVSLEEEAQAYVDPESVLESLTEVFQSPGYEPPIAPAVALELLELSRKPEVSFGAVRHVMERDPLIAAKVLRTAQSAAYSSGDNVIRTLDDALVRIGLKTLSNLFMESAMRMKVFRAVGFEAPMKELARHSAATAHLARHLARRTALFDEHLFLCGLLHDIGIAAGFIALTQLQRGKTVPAFDDVWPGVCGAHEMASDKVCRAWKLPPDIALIVGHHHQVTVGGHVHPMAAVLSLSDWVAGELGFAMETEALRPLPHHLAVLGLTDANLHGLVTECKDVVARVED
ncbi:MAG TPA: HDOD domain-containing protein [Labilithrix sp.]|nr:HDOD domain-containing protein [Labilithrix sp.]